MEQYKDTRIGRCTNGLIYIQGDFSEWYIEDENILDHICPIQLHYCEIQKIDQDGIYVTFDNELFQIIENGEVILNDKLLREWRYNK